MKRKTVTVLESEMGAVQGEDLATQVLKEAITDPSWPAITDALLGPPTAPPEPEQAPKPTYVAKSGPNCTYGGQPVLPHPLEMAPVNSKIVVTQDGAVLAMPETESLILSRPDPAARLPVGAKISKTRSAEGETLYVATLLNSERPEQPSIHGSAIEAIQQFPEIHYNR